MTKTDAVLNSFRTQLHSALDAVAGLNGTIAEQAELIDKQKKQLEELAQKSAKKK